MTATAEPRSPQVDGASSLKIERGAGVELLGPVHGSGYRDGAALVRRGDGQVVQLGPLMYAVLQCADGGLPAEELAAAMSDRLGRSVDTEHVIRLARKLAGQGLLAGTEHHAPPRRNPLLALRWKVLVTNPTVTRRLTAPFSFLFRRWVMWPVLAAFGGVFWFVLIHKGVASATAEAFTRPGLLLLVFVLAVLSAGFHELGHAAACRYGGATPGGMGVGLYLVWPAFYTDVTDAYRLPRRARLRVDLGGLYFNAIVAVITMAVWLAVRVDALLLLVALQLLQMVKQLSPVIRADGYHILSDATGIPDLYAHIGPTLRQLLPGRRPDQSALSGRARFLVTAWVLIVVPVLLSLMVTAILLFPRLATSAWQSGRHIIVAMPKELDHGQVLPVLASLVRLLALSLPVLGSALVTQRVVRTTARKALAWSDGRPARRIAVSLAGAGAVAAILWAWWPAGQYQPVHASDRGTLASFTHAIVAPQSVVRPSLSSQAQVTPGKHLAIAMIPVGGATKQHPALFVLLTRSHQPAVAMLSRSSPNPSQASSFGSSTSTQTGTGRAPSVATQATAFPFKLPAKPGPGGTQAVAVGTKSGGVTYDIAYAVVTVSNGAPVTNTNSAFAIADCNACTTVAVSFQVVLVIGQSKDIAPINAAGALNYQCPACVTTALADQIVVTLKSAPSPALLAALEADLRQLNELSALGASASPAAITAEVAAVQQEIDTQLNNSGLLSGPSNLTTSTGPAGAAPPGQSNTTPSGAAGSSSQGSAGAAPPSTSTTSTSGSASSAPTGTSTQPTPATGTTPAAPASSSSSGGSSSTGLGSGSSSSSSGGSSSAP